MADFFTLELDTTGPVIDVHAPPDATPQTDFDVTIQANEQLARQQDIFIIDAAEKRHNVIFKHDGSAYIGVVDAGGLAAGVATLYVRVRDTVHNLSDVKTVSINIKRAAKIIITTDDTARGIGSADISRGIQSGDGQRVAADASDAVRVTIARDTIRDIKAGLNELSDREHGAAIR